VTFTKLAVILTFGSFVLSALLTALVRKCSLKTGFVSSPSANRHSRKIIPLGGGIAIFGTIFSVIISAMLIVKFLVAPGHLDRLGPAITIHAQGFLDKIDQLLFLLLCITGLFILGLIDDKKHLSPFLKLLFQFIIALIAAAFADVRVELFIDNRIVTSLLSAFWIVMIINAFNFLDNMDGLSAGIAVITSAILYTAAALSGQVFVSSLALLFIGTLLGFLVFNFPPAKIYMGDAGSLLVGFFVAMLSLKTTYYHQSQSGPWYPVMMPLVALAVPLYDFTSVTLIRISQGKSPFVGDTQHFSHRLKRHGLTDAQTVLTLYLATLCTGLGATFLYQVDLAGAILILTQTFMILAIIAIFETTRKNNDKSET
jgi:UDP-GlcNAc:undecaprenyl-phosphate GlcNAc-1-phosphate transferase